MIEYIYTEVRWLHSFITENKTVFQPSSLKLASNERYVLNMIKDSIFR